MKYKSYRFVDGKARWIIVDENENIVNRNPSKDELKGIKRFPEKDGRSNSRNKNYTDEELLNYLKQFYEENGRVPIHIDFNANPNYPSFSNYFKYFGSWNRSIELAGLSNKYYNSTDTCNRCKIEKLSPGNACREYDEKGNWNGNWLCTRCYRRYDYIERYICDHRTENQELNTSNAKGDLFQELTCRWRSTVSTIPVEDLNKKNDNYKSPIDHTPDSELGIIQTGGRLYNSRNGMWTFGGLEREWDKKFDVIICYCTSKDGKIIERIYIIPKEEIKDKRTTIGIYKNPSRYVWYEQYRIIDEETIKKVNEIWKDILREKY